jgi:hypothetical protein
VTSLCGDHRGCDSTLSRVRLSETKGGRALHNFGSRFWLQPGAAERDTHASRPDRRGRVGTLDRPEVIDEEEREEEELL